MEDCRDLLLNEDWVLGWEALRSQSPKLSKEDFIVRKPSYNNQEW